MRTPLYDNCTYSSECNLCGKWLGFWVSDENSKKARVTHMKTNCKSKKK